MTRASTRACLASFALVLSVSEPATTRLHAQNRAPALASPHAGRQALGLSLRRLGTVGRFLQTDAHPDDENNALLAWLTRGQGMRAAVLTLTRGNGGQNEIGPELFEDLAVVRTEELLAAHRLDGADQLFGRAVDFGFSFSPDETFRKWGREEILSDLVRHLRTVRPDVVLAMWQTGDGGGQHHQATARLTIEAFRAAADPDRFPEQLAAGLRPWQAGKLYVGGGPPAGLVGAVAPAGSREAPKAGVDQVLIDATVYDPWLGRTYFEIGAEARSYHKGQGTGQVVPLPVPAASVYTLADASDPAWRGRTGGWLFDGIDTSIRGLARFAGAAPPEALIRGLALVAEEAAAAKRQFETSDDAAAFAAIVDGLEAVRSLRSTLGAMGLPDSARYDIDFRLADEERDFEDAALAAAGVTVSAVSDDGLVVAGQRVGVRLFVSAGTAAAGVRVSGVALHGFDGAPSCSGGAADVRSPFDCRLDPSVPATAALTDIYWSPQPGVSRSVFAPDVPFGAPFRPTPFRAEFRLTLGRTPIAVTAPVIYRYQGEGLTGEKQMEMKVVPAFSVKVAPERMLVPLPRPRTAAGREVQVSVTNGLKAAAETHVRLLAPGGWTVVPDRGVVAFSREDEVRTLRFVITPPKGAQEGEVRLRAEVTSPVAAGTVFDRGYQVVEYPHIQRRHVVHPAEARVKLLGVRVAPGVRVGYVMGVGDQVPSALEQLGAAVSAIGPDELAWGDLSRYDVIVTGVRAYERRDDLRANNRRLLDYAEAGGTVLVQYNKMEFNQAQYGPLPARVSSARVTDEGAPVTVLQPRHPVFTFPNPIGERAWAGWVQERGLYFLGEKDPAYQDLVELADPFPFNPGTKRGALVEARVGKGRWLYIGLGLWRQVPAATDGAYLLLANLISLPKAPVERSGQGRTAQR